MVIRLTVKYSGKVPANVGVELQILPDLLTTFLSCCNILSGWNSVWSLLFLIQILWLWQTI